ncbi:patatin-like phospholipase family protein [Sorangium sp. So ce1389]|uniref:patatin-like phospholipase family protein n=1 Tax=Sorangium sp. So ce1389 TaxID=3133336 RepID=UPI003F616DD6
MAAPAAIPAPGSSRAAGGERPAAGPAPQRRRIDFVLEGGGVKGIALVGAISAIHDQLEQRDEYRARFTLEGSRAAGTSAGAVIAALLVAGYTPAEIRRIIAGPEIARLADTTWLGRIPLVGRPLDITVGLLTELGAYKGDYFLQYLRGLLLDKGISTFKDLIVKGRERETNPLLRYRAHFVASDITRGTVLILPDDIDAERYGVQPDDLNVALAVRMSMSVPFFFRPVRLLGENGVNSYIVDGGLLSNFPVEVFDELHSTAANASVAHAVTLGFRIVQRRRHAIGFPFKALRALYALASTALQARNLSDMAEATEKLKWLRAIEINTSAVSALNFQLSALQKEILYTEGYTATHLAIDALLKKTVTVSRASRKSLEELGAVRTERLVGPGLPGTPGRE